MKTEMALHLDDRCVFTEREKRVHQRMQFHEWAITVLDGGEMPGQSTR